MKIDVFILKHGASEDLLQLARKTLADAGINSSYEAESFMIRMAFVRHYLQTYGDAKLELRVTDGRLYVSGEAGKVSFVI